MGTILLFGVEIEFDALSEILQKTAENNGSVLFYQEKSSYPSENYSTQLLQMVLDNEIPVRRSFEPDFSDLVDSYGNLKLL